MKTLTFYALFLITFFTFSQEKTITGIVVDETNMPLPGATVVIKGTTTGTSTDFDGKYTISANTGDVLSFSYVGYLDEQVKVKRKTTINITMQLDNSLEEVVVTALGIKRKPKKLATSIQKVKSSELNQAKGTNSATALVGKVSGLKISNNLRNNQLLKRGKKLSNSKIIRINGTSSTNIVLRGSSSITGKNKALIVIDGVISSEEALRKMNPNNIKGVNILKGASGTALYGSQGGNGVIVVSTQENGKSIKKSLDKLVNIANNKILKNDAQNDESYKEIQENNFERTALSPLSTFSIDIDKAAYTNVRRMINNGEVVNPNAVKIEEFINYFEYNYPQPKDEHPFSITAEVNKTPWNAKTKLVRIGLQGKKINQENLPASNLVFLIDVSGSMGRANKLGLLKKAFQFLTNQLREKDTVSIVVYAGAAGVVLESTNGSNKQKIIEALEMLESGGSTAGGKGIELAYKIAMDNFIKNGNNRVILATDGDFNVGASSDKDMEKLIEEKRKSGVYLTCLGFGYGNYKDAKLEILADKGNGNHGYIDSMQEAQKMFGKEFGGTLFTIAKDVKIQVEFNPAKVEAYRLIGYENRLLNDEDFIDDKKDAGELGSGHTVTALYEVILKGTKVDYLNETPELKYTKNASNNSFSDEMLTVKFRYKKPDENKSIEIVKTVSNQDVIYNQSDFNFSAAVALFGMQLRKSKYTNNTDFNNVIALAKKGIVLDKDGYRVEFIRLVKAL